MEHSNQIPSQLLERYFLGEVSQKEKERVETALKQNESLKEKLKEIQKSNEAFLKDFPAQREMEIIKEKHQFEKPRELISPKPKTMPWFQKPMVRVSFAFSLMFVVALSSFIMKQNNAQPEYRLKGMEPKLDVYLKTSEGPQLLKDGDSLSAGQTIQITYTSAGEKYGVIFSADGNQNITLHFPSQNSSDSRLEKEGKVQLDYAYQLDNAPNFEKFLFVTSSEPINPEKILENYREKWSKDKSFPKQHKLESHKKLYHINFFKK